MTPSILDRSTFAARHPDARPRVHPNGFIQLDLDAERRDRLHVWHPDVPSQGVNTIHNHSFDVESTVIVGEMTNVLVFPRFEYWRSDRITHDVYQVIYSGFEARLEKATMGAYIEAEEEGVVRAGETYLQDAFAFHIASNSPVCATVMTKRNNRKSRLTNVLLPRGTEPRPFPRADVMAYDAMWDIIEEVVSSMT